MAQTFSIPATLEGVSRKKDRSVSIRFSSLMEVNNDDFATIDKLFQSSGHLVFSEREVTSKDIPTDKIDSDLKSPSERLRAVLYALHMQKTDDPSTFRQFYESSMEKFINRVKDELDNKE